MGNNGVAQASDASVMKARDDVEPNMVNYSKIVLLLLGVSLSLSSMAGPMLDMCQEPQTDDCIAIVTRSSYGEAICGTTDDERMGTHTTTAHTQCILSRRGNRFMSTRTPSG